MLFTRADARTGRGRARGAPGRGSRPAARLLAWPADTPEPTGGLVRSSAPARPTCRWRARPNDRAATSAGATELVSTWAWPGCTGSWRDCDLLRRPRSIVVVAGMDGALPSVVAGLVGAGGGGANVGRLRRRVRGLAPLLTMLNACAPGVAVVNIDNGYGAGHLAAQIAARPRPSRAGCELRSRTGQVVATASDGGRFRPTLE